MRADGDNQYAGNGSRQGSKYRKMGSTYVQVFGGRIRMLNAAELTEFRASVQDIIDRKPSKPVRKAPL